MALGGSGGGVNKDVVIRIESDVSDFTSGIATAQAGLSSFTSQAQAMSATVGSAFTSVGKSVNWMANQMMIVGGAGSYLSSMLTGAFSEATAPIMEYEKQLSGVLSLLDSARGGAEAYAQTSSEISLMAKTISEQSLFSMSQVTEGMYTLGQAGVDTAEKMRDYLVPISQLATGQNADLGQTINTVMSVMNAYGMEASQTAQITNLFAKACTDSLTTVDDLTSGMKYLTPVMSAAGVSIEDAVTAWTMLNDLGYTGENSGRILRDMMNDIQSPTAEATEVMARHNIQLYDNQDVLTALQSTYNTAIDNEESLTAAKKLATAALSEQKEVSTDLGIEIRKINEQITEFKQAESDPHSALLDSLTKEKDKYTELKDAASEYYDTLQDAADERKEVVETDTEQITQYSLTLKQLELDIATAKKKAASIENPVIKELTDEKNALKQKKLNAQEEYQNKATYTNQSKALSLQIRQLDVEIAAAKNTGYSSDSLEVRELRARKEALQLQKIASDGKVTDAKNEYEKTKGYSIEISKINSQLATEKANTKTNPEVVALQSQIDSLKQQKLDAEKKLADDKKQYNDAVDLVDKQKKAVEEYGKAATKVDKEIAAEKKILSTQYESQLKVLEDQKNALTRQKNAADETYQSMSDGVQGYTDKITEATKATNEAKSALDAFTPTGIKSLPEVLQAFANGNLTQAEFFQIFGKQSGAGVQKLVSNISGYDSRKSSLLAGEASGEAETQANLVKNSAYGVIKSTQNELESTTINAFQKSKNEFLEVVKDFKENVIPKIEEAKTTVIADSIKPLQDAVDTASELVDKFNDLSPAIKEAGTAAAVFAGIWGQMLAPLVLLGGIGLKIIADMFIGVGKLITPTEKLAVAVEKLAVAQEASNAAQMMAAETTVDVVDDGFPIINSDTSGKKTKISSTLFGADIASDIVGNKIATDDINEQIRAAKLEASYLPGGKRTAIKSASTSGLIDDSALIATNLIEDVATSSKDFNLEKYLKDVNAAALPVGFNLERYVNSLGKTTAASSKTRKELSYLEKTIWDNNKVLSIDWTQPVINIGKIGDVCKEAGYDLGSYSKIMKNAAGDGFTLGETLTKTVVPATAATEAEIGLATASFFKAQDALTGADGGLVGRIKTMAGELIERFTPAVLGGSVALSGSEGLAAGGVAAAGSTGILAGALALLTNPLVWVGVAVVALAAIWFTNFHNIQERVQGFIDWFDTNFSGIFDTVSESIDKILSGFEGMWNGISEIIGGIIDGDFEEFLLGWADLGGGIITILEAVVEGTGTIMIDLGIGIVGILTNMAGGVYQAAIYTFSHIPRALMGVLQGVENLLFDAGGWVLKLLGVDITDEQIARAKKNLAIANDKIVTGLNADMKALGLGGFAQDDSTNTLTSEMETELKRDANKAADAIAKGTTKDIEGTTKLKTAKKELKEVEKQQRQEILAAIKEQTRGDITNAQLTQRKIDIENKYKNKIAEAKKEVEAATSAMKTQTKATDGTEDSQSMLNTAQSKYNSLVGNTSKSLETEQSKTVDTTVATSDLSNEFVNMGTNVDGTTDKVGGLDASITNTLTNASTPLAFPALDQTVVANTNTQLDNIIKKMQQIQSMGGVSGVASVGVNQTQPQTTTGRKHIANANQVIVPGFHLEGDPDPSINTGVTATRVSTGIGATPAVTTHSGSGTVVPYNTNGSSPYTTTGNSIGTQITNAVGTVTTMAGYITSNSAIGVFFKAGQTVGNAIATGISNFLKANSPPKEGPLRDLEASGKNLMQQFSTGMMNAGVVGNVSLMAHGIMSELDNVVARNTAVNTAFTATNARVSSSPSGAPSGIYNITNSINIDATGAVIRDDTDITKLAKVLAPKINNELQSWKGGMSL